MTDTRSLLRRAAAGAGALAAAAAIVAAATASYAADDPPPFKTGTVPGAWVSASPNPVRCTFESQTIQIRLSWWTPPRGLNDRPDAVFANMVSIDGKGFDIRPWPTAGEEHTATVPFACNQASHTYAVSNPGGGAVSVVVNRSLVSIKDRIDRGAGLRTRTDVVHPTPGTTEITDAKPCALSVKGCPPDVEQPQPQPQPKPGPGPVGGDPAGDSAGDGADGGTGPASGSTDSADTKFKTRVDPSRLQTKVELPSPPVLH